MDMMRARAPRAMIRILGTKGRRVATAWSAERAMEGVGVAWRKG